MNRKEAIRQTQLLRKLEDLGFNEAEFDRLRRISMTLSRWAERECNGEIERDEANRPRCYPNPGMSRFSYPIADKETGAIRRLKKILALHPGWTYYHQGDPRGAALYLIPPGAELYSLQKIDSCYSSIGICIY